MLDIKDAVAVITGAGSGIGEAVAREWAAKGGKLLLADIDGENLERVRSGIMEQDGEVISLVCDVTKEADTRKLASAAVAEYGKINLVVPCAGIFRDGLMLNIDKETQQVSDRMSLDQFQSVLDINLTGVFLTVRDCTEQMVNHGCRGLICLMSSTGALGTAGQINYSSTKAAMSVMPKVITAEFFRRGVADRIRCVAIAPGYTDTSMVRAMDEKIVGKLVEQVPIRRLIQPEEVASLIFELYRNEACAADVYHINGGLRLGSGG